MTKQGIDAVVLNVVKGFINISYGLPIAGSRGSYRSQLIRNDIYSENEKEDF